MSLTTLCSSSSLSVILLYGTQFRSSAVIAIGPGCLSLQSALQLSISAWLSRPTFLFQYAPRSAVSARCDNFYAIGILVRHATAIRHQHFFFFKTKIRFFATSNRRSNAFAPGDGFGILEGDSAFEVESSVADSFAFRSSAFSFLSSALRSSSSL